MKPGHLSVGIDHLLHLKMGEKPTNLEEGLLDMQLFLVHIMDTHFEDIIHFLMTVPTLEGYKSQQKKELLVRAT